MSNASCIQKVEQYVDTTSCAAISLGTRFEGCTHCSHVDRYCYSAGCRALQLNNVTHQLELAVHCSTWLQPIFIHVGLLVSTVIPSVQVTKLSESLAGPSDDQSVPECY